MNGKDCPERYSHDYFDHMKNNGLGFFFIVTRAEHLDLHDAEGSHNIVEMSAEEKPVIENLMELKLITILHS